MDEDQNTILNDKRKISLVTFDFDGEEGAAYRASPDLVIEAYPEAGPHCYLPWIRVIQKGEVVTRFPAGMVSIHYEATHD